MIKAEIITLILKVMKSRAMTMKKNSSSSMYYRM
jgi:hypothetical protein